ncbi:IS3 family transposase [Streptomyces fagopyri]|uniref:IS3 family transposase n=1 Tax=Streptomyces fagopyri TaxID=2662397 RepID=UPI00370F8A0B
MAAQGFRTHRITALLNVSESGFYAWRERPTSARRLRHVRLTRLILDIHRESGSAFGYRRIRQALEHRFGIRVSHGTVELLMNQAGIRGRRGGGHEHTGSARYAVPGSCWITDTLACRTSEGGHCAMPAPNMTYRQLLDGNSPATAGPAPDQQTPEGVLTRNVAASDPPDAKRGGILTCAFADQAERVGRASNPASRSERCDHAVVEAFRENTRRAPTALRAQPGLAPLRTELSEIPGGLDHQEYALGRNSPS